MKRDSNGDEATTSSQTIAGEEPTNDDGMASTPESLMLVWGNDFCASLPSRNKCDSPSTLINAIRNPVERDLDLEDCSLLAFPAVRTRTHNFSI